MERFNNDLPRLYKRSVVMTENQYQGLLKMIQFAENNGATNLIKNGIITRRGINEAIKSFKNSKLI